MRTCRLHVWKRTLELVIRIRDSRTYRGISRIAVEGNGVRPLSSTPRNWDGTPKSRVLHIGTGNVWRHTSGTVSHRARLSRFRWVPHVTNVRSKWVEWIRCRPSTGNLNPI